jgi:hypothetical protein
MIFPGLIDVVACRFRPPQSAIVAANLHGVFCGDVITQHACPFQVGWDVCARMREVKGPTKDKKFRSMMSALLSSTM